MDIKYRADLYKLLPKNPITVEVGCAECNFSLQIVSEWKPSRHYAIDNWNHIHDTRGDGNQPQEWHESNYDQCLRKFKPYLEKVVMMRGISWDMAINIPDESVDFISIDACHSYECVKKDIEAYWPKLKGGGIMTWHDYMAPEYGVNTAVNEFAKANEIHIYDLPENKLEDAGAFAIKTIKIKL